MKKDDIDWSVYENIREVGRDEAHRRVEVCSETYYVNENTACIAHAILLLVDSLNDKSFK